MQTRNESLCTRFTKMSNIKAIWRTLTDRLRNIKDRRKNKQMMVSPSLQNGVARVQKVFVVYQTVSFQYCSNLFSANGRWWFIVPLCDLWSCYWYEMQVTCFNKFSVRYTSYCSGLNIALKVGQSFVHSLLFLFPPTMNCTTLDKGLESSYRSSKIFPRVRCYANM